MLSLKKISKNLQSQQILSQVSLNFEKGSCIALLGKNGAGKSTLIKILLQLVKPDFGAIEYNNKPLKLTDMQDFGYMPETNQIPENLTLLEFLTFKIKLLQPEEALDINELLAQAGLLDKIKSPISKLSKGQKRKALWLQAIIHKPKIIILDEPFEGLDPSSRRLLIQWIQNTVKENNTVIISTHDIEYLAPVCNFVYVLEQGNIVYEQHISLENHANQIQKILSFL